MADLVVNVLIGLAVVVLTAAISLFAVKGVRRVRHARQIRRHNRYVELLGELIANNQLDQHSLRRTAKYPEFRQAVLEYLRFLEGDDRAALVAMARRVRMVDELRSNLSALDRGTRAEAVEGLAEIADPATFEVLVFRLADPVPEIRIQAAAALARIGDERAVASILKAMDGEEPWAAQRFADALFTFGTAAVPGMCLYLTGTGRYRPLIARVLGLLGDLRAEPALIQSLQSSDLELRMRAASALGRAGTPQAVPYLLAMLRDDQWEVRAQAATALGGRMDTHAVPGLSVALGDTAWWVRHNAAAALVEIPGGAEALREALRHPDPYARDAAAAVLLSSGVARSAIDDYQSDDPLARDRARALIKGLVDSGKTEFFEQAGFPEVDLRTIRLGL